MPLHFKTLVLELPPQTSWTKERQRRKSHFQRLDRYSQLKVYVCADINWGGECAYFDYPLNECWELTGDFYYTGHPLVLMTELCAVFGSEYRILPNPSKSLQN